MHNLDKNMLNSVIVALSSGDVSCDDKHKLRVKGREYKSVAELSRGHDVGRSRYYAAVAFDRHDELAALLRQATGETI